MEFALPAAADGRHHHDRSAAAAGLGARRPGADAADHADPAADGAQPRLSPIWFGIFLVRTMEIGFVHPPIGINLYVIQGIAKDVPLSRIFQRRRAVPGGRPVTFVAGDRLAGDGIGAARLVASMSLLMLNLTHHSTDPLQAARVAAVLIGYLGWSVPG